MSTGAADPLTDPGQILGTSSGYWRSFALQAAVKLDLFTVVGDGAAPGSEIAEAIGGDERGVTTLLNALAALGLIEKRDGRYRNTEAGRTFLVRSSPRYIGYLVRHHANLAEAWTRLDESVRSGQPVRERSSGNTGAIQEDFLRGMHTQAMAIAPAVARQIDLVGRARLLDVGGGPGTWAAQFCLANPKLSATVFDFEGTRPFAEQTIAQLNVSDRVTFHGGDFTSDELPGGFDVAWLSHILHGEPPESCRMIIRKAVEALNDQGLVLVHEFVLDADGTGPLFPALFSLNTLLGTPGGRSYTRGELEDMLTGTGVGGLRLLEFVGPTQSRILAGTIGSS